jgi:uncharacterized protein (TIGR00255 family)
LIINILYKKFLKKNLVAHVIKAFCYICALNISNNMLHSMTGYGRASRTFGEKGVTVEVRALNSKMTDIRFRMPSYYKEKEIELRRILTEQAERGKIDVSISIKSLTGEDDFVLNHDLFKNYYRELKQLTSELQMGNTDMLTAILRLPNVVGAEEETVPEEEWEATQGALQDALRDFQKFRSTEGGAMEKDLRERVVNILDLLNKILPYEKERIGKLRQRLRQNLEEFL